MSRKIFGAVDFGLVHRESKPLVCCREKMCIFCPLSLGWRILAPTRERSTVQGAYHKSPKRMSFGENSAELR